MNNVYPEVGSFFNALVVADPVLCMHGMGKNIKQGMSFPVTNQSRFAAGTPVEILPFDRSGFTR